MAAETQALSLSIGIYRAQAEILVGRCDGKFGLPSEEVKKFRIVSSLQVPETIEWE
jgi:hypothetical protein